MEEFWRIYKRMEFGQLKRAPEPPRQVHPTGSSGSMQIMRRRREDA